MGASPDGGHPYGPNATPAAHHPHVGDPYGTRMPNAPTSVNATPGAGSVDLTWTLASDPGMDAGSPATVTDHYVTAYVDGAPVMGEYTGSALAAHTFAGLTPGQAYTFTVKAVHAQGVGDASEPSDPATPS